ncbi:MAG TPA: M14 family zinc carboxypeptidase [Acidothermaceae bacterium]|nr:M14 family zinc carboxypeptidase [Acidothermaceae bacterium]
MLVVPVLTGCAADRDADAATAHVSSSPTVMSSSAVVPMPSRAAPTAAGTSAIAAAPDASSPTRLPALVNRTTTFGYSARGQPLVVTEIGNPLSAHRVLIVGSIHGNELAGDHIASALKAAGPQADADVWIVQELNPDGAAAATRQNADGVDLNRNFPFQWRPLGPRGSFDYSGTRALSEPESAAAALLITRIRPTLAIWFHQHLAAIDDSQGPINVERRFSALVGLPLVRLTDYPGSVTGWQDAIFGPTAFVVELPPGQLAPDSAKRYVDAIETVETLN